MKSQVAPKDAAHDSSHGAAHSSKGGGVALAPPAYGIEFADKLEAEAPLQAPPGPVLQRQAAAAAPPPNGSGNLPIGPPDDPLEKEADQIADRVMRMPLDGTQFATLGATLSLQRKCACGGEGECEACKEEATLQRMSNGANRAGVAPASVHEVLHSPGQTLSPGSRSFFGSRFGRDFSQVRVHSDTKAAESAAAVGAHAYTVGDHVVFGAGNYSPDSAAGQRLLAHELTHVVQQGGQHNALQRKPGDVTSYPVTGVPGATETFDPDKHTYVYDFRGKPWITVHYRNHADIEVDFTRFGQSSEQLLLQIKSSAPVDVTIDLDVEQEVRNSRKSMENSSIGYDLAVHGSIHVLKNGLTTTIQGPTRRVVTDVTRHTVTIEGLPEPDVREHEEHWLAGNIKDTYPSFKNLADLRSYLAANRKRSFVIVRAKDGRYIARPVTGKEITQLADHVRHGNYDVKKQENIDWYKNAYQTGEYQGLWVEGKEYNDLGSLEDVFFGDPKSAAKAGSDEELECEVYQMGSIDTDLGISYGRKPLTHAQATARWTELDGMKQDEIDRLQTEAGHPFQALHVRGVASMHTIDTNYFWNRDEFRANLPKLDAMGGPRGSSESAGSQDYFEAQLDREQDDPNFVALLRQHPGATYTYGTAHYEKVVQAGQKWAADSFQKSAYDIRDFVADDARLAKWVLQCPQLPYQDVMRTLAVFDLMDDDLRWYNALTLPQYSVLLASGGNANGVTLALFRAKVNEVAKKMEDARDSILKGDIIAIKEKGEFGDSVRKAVYKQYGYTLDSKAFPYQDKLSASHVADSEMMGGSRSSFSSLGEQMFATELRREVAQDNALQWAKRIGLAIGAIVLVVALNAAGAAIAGALFAEGTLGYMAVSALVVGTGLTASEALQAHIAGVDMSVGDLLSAEAWNVATAGLLGKLGGVFKESSAAVRLSVVGTAAFGLGMARFLSQHKGPVSSDELVDFMIENAVMFAAMEAAGALARPLNVEASLWGRARRLGIKAAEIDTFNNQVNNLLRDLSSLSARPAEAAREQARIEQTTSKLLAQQEQLVKDLSSKLSTQGDADAIQAEAGVELQRIKAAVEGMKRAKFLATLKLKPVGQSQTVYTFENSPDAIQQLKEFFPGSRIESQSDGTLELYLAGSKDPVTLKPASGSQPAAPDTRIDINTASVKELQQLPGIGAAKAKAIVEARESRPGKQFTSVDDLRGVAGIGEAIFSKIAGLIVANEPPTMDARRTNLAERQKALLERADLKGYSDASLEAIRRLRPLDTKDAKTLADTETKIKAAEQQAGGALNRASKAALERTAKRLGADVGQLRTGGLSTVPDDLVGDALSRVPQGTPNLGVAELRGIIWAHILGVPVERVMGTGKVVGAKARNQALDTFGRIADAGVRNCGQVLRDMVASPKAWRGGSFVLDVARYDIGIENIEAFEERVMGPVGRRDIDIVLKDKTHAELKNWSYEAWMTYRTGIADGANRTDPGQFLTDVGNANFDPNVLKRLRYIFNYPPPASVGDLRAYFRAQLEMYMKGQVSPAQAKVMLDAFDKADSLIVVSKARAEGGVAPEPDLSGVVPVPVPPRHDKDQTQAPVTVP